MEKKQIKKVLLPVVAASGYALATSAHAEGTGVAGLFSSVATELGGVQSGVLSVMSVLVVILAIFIGWSYVKRTK